MISLFKMADFEYVNAQETKEEEGPKPPLDFSYHFSRVTAARKESTVKKFYKYFQIPGLGNLAGGESNSIHSGQEWGIPDSCTTHMDDLT